MLGDPSEEPVRCRVLQALGRARKQEGSFIPTRLLSNVGARPEQARIGQNPSDQFQRHLQISHAPKSTFFSLKIFKGNFYCSEHPRNLRPFQLPTDRRKQSCLQHKSQTLYPNLHRNEQRLDRNFRRSKKSLINSIVEPYLQKFQY